MKINDILYFLHIHLNVRSNNICTKTVRELESHFASGQECNQKGDIPRYKCWTFKC